VTFGPKWIEILVELGYPASMLASGPALRFDYIWNGAIRSPAVNRSDSTPVIVAAASIGFNDSCEFVTKIVDAFRGSPNIKTLLKFHPKMAVGWPRLITVVLRALDLPRLPQQFEITQQPIAKLIQAADLVIYSGTTVGLEAVAQGVPALHVQSDVWFDMDPMEFVKPDAIRARTSNEIKERALAALASISSTAHDRSGSAPAATLFSEVKEETLEAFLVWEQVAPVVAAVGNS
jgi:hypothetical protein